MIGMSDHGPIPGDFINNAYALKNGYIDGQMDYDTFINEYLHDIDEAKNKYDSKMKVLRGIEIEYFFGNDDYYKELKSHLDYMILGQHYMMENGKCLDAYYDINSNNVLEYSKFVIAGLNTKLFDILAHPDVFMYHYISENNKLREFDDNAIMTAKAIIEACIKNDVVIEFNLGGIYKGLKKCKDFEVDYLYTTKRFWKIVSEYKEAKVIIGCDAHIIDALSSNNIIKAKQILDDLNIKYIDKL